MHLPSLPMEFWMPKATMSIAAEVRRSMDINDFTELLRKTGYARIYVEIDAEVLLKPGVLIRKKREVFWQQFIYKNLSLVCYKCGRLGHADDRYWFSEGELSPNNNDCPLHPKNIVAVKGKGVRSLYFL